MWRSKRCYIALLLFSTIFLGLFARSSDASAVSASFTVNSSNYSSGFNICNNSTTPKCDIYNYILLEFHDVPDSVNQNSRFRLSMYTKDSQVYDFVPYGMEKVLFQFNQSPQHWYSLSYYAWPYYPSGASVTITLSSDNPLGGSLPSGTISITENGTFDVSSYASAEVDVPAPVVTTPYDGKLDSLIQAVYVVAGTMLVIYFFYAMYRIYMGGKT